MKFLIVFKKSGDTIEFNAVNAKMFEFMQWLIHLLNVNGSNSFICASGNGIPVNAQKLHDTIIDVNSFLVSLAGNEFEVKNKLEDYTESNFLNKLHADWANIPDGTHNGSHIGSILEEAGVIDRYRKINTDLHEVEWEYKYIHYETEIHQVINYPAMEELLTNHYTHFSILSTQLGRCLYNKFKWGDSKLEWDDLNNFTTIYGKVQIGMCTPESIPLSPEYINWCRIHNKKPTGDRLAIGNVVDYEKNSKKIRKVLYRNLNDKFLII